MSCWIYAASYSLRLGTFKAAVKTSVLVRAGTWVPGSPPPLWEGRWGCSESMGRAVGFWTCTSEHMWTSPPPPPCIDMSRSQVISDTEAEQALDGGGGVPRHKAFRVPHFFDYRKYPSFSFHDLSWVPRGKFKQLLIREGRGHLINQEDRGEIVKRNNSAASGQGVLAPHQSTHQYLRAALQIPKPLQVGQVNISNGMLLPSTETPDGLEPDWWCWLLFTLPPANQKNVHEPIMPSLNHC